MPLSILTVFVQLISNVEIFSSVFQVCVRPWMVPEHALFGSPNLSQVISRHAMVQRLSENKLDASLQAIRFETA